MPRWQLRTVYSSTTLLVLSGIIWLLLHYFGRVDGELGTLPNPYEHLLLGLHGGAAMAFLIVLGSLLPVHVLRGWNQRRNLVAGFALAGAQLVLIVTAFGLYYAAGDALRSLVGLVHWIVGLLIVGLFTWHVLAGRGSARG